MYRQLDQAPGAAVRRQNHLDGDCGDTVTIVGGDHFPRAGLRRAAWAKGRGVRASNGVGVEGNNLGFALRARAPAAQRRRAHDGGAPPRMDGPQSSAGGDLAKVVHRTVRGLPALPRAVSRPRPLRHLPRPICRDLRGQRLPELTATVRADAGLDCRAANAERSLGCGGLDLRWAPAGEWAGRRRGGGGMPRGQPGKHGKAQRCFNEAPLVAHLAATPAHRAARSTEGRVHAGAIRPRYPHKTAAAPCPRGALHPRALAAAGDQLEGARAQVVHAE